MYWDYNNPYLPKSRDKWKFTKLCKRLNSEGRPPSPREWDMLIDYMYPEEDRILERLDTMPAPKEKMVKVFNYTYHDMSTGKQVDKYIHVPVSAKGDYM